MLWIDGTFDTAFLGLAYGVMSVLSCGALGVDYWSLANSVNGPN